jgi:hypothetical protein
LPQAFVPKIEPVGSKLSHLLGGLLTNSIREQLACRVAVM